MECMEATRYVSKYADTRQILGARIRFRPKHHRIIPQDQLRRQPSPHCFRPNVIMLDHLRSWTGHLRLIGETLKSSRLAGRRQKTPGQRCEPRGPLSLEIIPWVLWNGPGRLNPCLPSHEAAWHFSRDRLPAPPPLFGCDLLEFGRE